MKRNIIFGVLLLSGICVGSMFLGHVSAQKQSLRIKERSLVASPETSTPQTLPFFQNWSNTALITVNDDWSGVAGIEGYLGQDITVATGVDPQTLLTTSVVASDLDAIANQSSPNTLTSGGVAEFDGITNPTIALQGSGTADAPYVIFYLSTTGRTNINVAYNLRDIDGSADNAIQPVALQYRVGNSGNFTNVPAGFVADASSGPSLATLVTPVSAALGSDANNQPLVQVRVITANAVGSDEWIGIDDIKVTTANLFTARLNGASEVPANASAGTGYGVVVLNDAETQITASFYWSGLSSGTTSGHIHGPAAVGVNAPVLFDMTPATGATSGTRIDQTFAVTAAQVANLRAGLFYFNIHSTMFGAGEIRGQILSGQPDAPVDFNVDGKSDYSVYRITSAVGGRQVRWFGLYNNGTNTGFEADWGLDTDKITPGDFDGDGKDDLAVWRSASGTNSAFFILQSSTGTFRIVQFGLESDDPFMIADYDGDGKDDPAIYRPGATINDQSHFWWRGSTGVAAGRDVPVGWGAGPSCSEGGDCPVPGDFTGDGKADFCVYKNNGFGNAIFWIHPGTGAADAPTGDLPLIYFGLYTDLFVPGDYDGDGKTDIASTRTEGGNLIWYIRPSSGAPSTRTHWGIGGSSGDIPVQGDYDGDGKTDIAVWRFTSPSTFFVLGSTAGIMYQQYGLNSDLPTAEDTH